MSEQTQNNVKNNIQKLLEAYQHSDAEMWASLISQKSPETRLGIIKQLIPDAFISKRARKIHENLDNHYPELLKILSGTVAFYTSFPDDGIPAQAFSIAKHVKPEFNAGIGVAKTYDGDIMMNPEFQQIFDMLKPEKVISSEWVKLRNSVFKYNDGLGAPWYRQLSYLRYLRDGTSDPVALKELKTAFRIKPIPTYGGTVALSIAFDVAVGKECPLILPKTYWGNINLKMDHAQTLKEISNYIDENGKIHPDELWRILDQLKSRGYKKAAVYFNFPHNPTGIVPTREQAVELEDIIQGMADENFQIAVICDEPYYPFVRGKDAIKVPFSHYMKPGENRNILTFVSINGTKRDGMYGMRHADLIILTPVSISNEGIRLFERNILAGYMRGAFSFSCALSQYLLGRAVTGDPLIALKEPWEITLSQKFYDNEMELVDYVKTSVTDTLTAISQITDLERITDSIGNDAYGGFFATYKLSENLKQKEISSFDIHKAGLQNNCGVISTNEMLRISGMISKISDEKFVENLKKTLKYAELKKEQTKFDESLL